VIVHADLHAAMPTLLAAPIASVITDPPYADRVHDRATSNGTAGVGPVNRDLGFAALDGTMMADIARLIGHASRWSTVFSDLESAHLWRQAVERDVRSRAFDEPKLTRVDYIRSVPWVRWSQPQLSGDRPPSGAEMITMWHASGRKHWSGPGSLTAFDQKSLRGRDKYSCEKPLDLMLSLVSWFSDVGDLVCDPCAGSGTTGLACRLLGRDCIMIERDAAACELAHTRCESPLTERDQTRVARWVESQQEWLHGGCPDTDAGRARYARATADLDAATVGIQLG